MSLLQTMSENVVELSELVLNVLLDFLNFMLNLRELGHTCYVAAQLALVAVVLELYVDSSANVFAGVDLNNLVWDLSPGSFNQFAQLPQLIGNNLAVVGVASRAYLDSEHQHVGVIRLGLGQLNTGNLSVVHARRLMSRDEGRCFGIGEVNRELSHCWFPFPLELIGCSRL
nr:MAG TPA: hypothetical protein [Caudoviricetes sp.]